MTTSWLRRCAFVVAFASPLAGCAFFTKSDPVVLRYFTPETLATRPDSSGVTLAMRPTSLDLRLGRVNSASYLKDRIAFRDRNFESGYYEGAFAGPRKPEAYLRARPAAERCSKSRESGRSSPAPGPLSTSTSTPSRS